MEVLVTGATGYIGTRLCASLARRGHVVCALVRPGSDDRVPGTIAIARGDALDPASVAAALRSDDTLVHLVGTPHPDPSKAASFERVDLGSILASVAAAQRVAIAQLVYVSVAHPAPVMHAYVAARMQGEAAIPRGGPFDALNIDGSARIAGKARESLTPSEREAGCPAHAPEH